MAKTADPPLADLRALGRRCRQGPVMVTWAPPRHPAEPPGHVATVAFAVGRHTGKAVTRNRIRRRLRAALRELGYPVPAGTYLVAARTEVATMNYRELVSDLGQAIDKLTGRR